LLKTISIEEEVNEERVLALVTGVPGAGKTPLLGLQFVYDIEQSASTLKPIITKSPKRLHWDQPDVALLLLSIELRS
jgi:hypothetical protein